MEVLVPVLTLARKLRVSFDKAMITEALEKPSVHAARVPGH